MVGTSSCPALSETQSCNTAACPVNCAWTTWSAWGTCSASCGGGTQTRTRSQDPPASGGGADCVGASSESQACNTDGCPVDCVWGEWSSWGACSVECDGGTQISTRSILTLEVRVTLKNLVLTCSKMVVLRAVARRPDHRPAIPTRVL